MERNNYHQNKPSGCTKIRQALSNNSAMRAIHRISNYHHQEPSSGSPLPQPRHIRGNYNGEGNGAVPIKFVDQANHPTFNNGHAQVGNRIEPERPKYYASGNAGGRVKGEVKGKSNTAQEFDQRQHNEKKDMNYIFGEYIQRAREKLRTVSNVGKAHQSKPAQEEAGLNVVSKKKDTHKDQISDFINRTKKKIRTTSSIRFGKNESLRRG